MKYDVTIGIPVYQSESYIRMALESALSQTYSSIEFLIIDDGGDDHSIDIIRDIIISSPRKNDIRILSHSQNQGVSSSRNQIIDEAHGEYLFFMDSDDVIKKDTIFILMQNIRQYAAEIAFGSYEKIEIFGERVVYQYPSLQLLGSDQLACFAYRKFGGIQASSCNYLVRTSLLREKNLRFINTDYWEDLVFTFDLVTYISKAVLLPDITYTYLCRKDSLSHYQERCCLSKSEILRNVKTIDYLKDSSSRLFNKAYISHRCFIIGMMDFYMACHIIKRRKMITPYIANSEIKAMMTHVASFRQICSFRHYRMKNLGLYLLGKLPSFLCVATIWLVGKMKKFL